MGNVMLGPSGHSRASGLKLEPAAASILALMVLGSLLVKGSWTGESAENATWSQRMIELVRRQMLTVVFAGLFIYFLREVRSGERSKIRVIGQAPGSTLLNVADFLVSRRSMDEVFLPTIQDMREEYFEALSQGRHRKAAWIRVRGTWAVLSAASALFGVRLSKLIVGIWRAS
jgi:hypothetical protein